MQSRLKERSTVLLAWERGVWISRDVTVSVYYKSQQALLICVCEAAMYYFYVSICMRVVAVIYIF